MTYKDEVVIAFVLGVAIASMAGCSDKSESFYASMADAIGDRAVERGWFPAALEPHVTALREVHNIDTNQVWGTFEFTDSDPLKPDGFRTLSAPEIAQQQVGKPGKDWWPAVLTGRLDTDSLENEGFRVFQELTSGVFIALNLDSGRGYFWVSSR